MTTKLKLYVFLFSLFMIVFFTDKSSAQQAENSEMVPCWGDWQVSLRIGTQMSGIKDEDFVASNFSPLLDVSLGKWFSPVIALQVGYKGWYFNTISDEEKHNYGYYYGEAVLNVNRLFKHYKDSCKWSLYLHGGSGYFYNYTYNRPNVCADFGISNNYRISSMFQVSLDISAIAGWDLYQGDEDILPGISLGIAYLF